eukprot:CAMPEP_0202388466 /NCGR_PEP_ID=MMETSP1127-20130417/77665_1 /ASSEMBLY_ACC=CAM_ASM_000462 /TAXON_ID=3047 /ORGANISM="Dunaliella tertiolecta, Strain CCMP1320" /LENGTH=107 /DNA_ID=CAMNT_0048989891 /DNA_START=313 /DNA_END=636 /DNA_ORIENTATION=-
MLARLLGYKPTPQLVLGILARVQFLVHLAVQPYAERQFYFPAGQAHKRHYPQHLGGNSYCSGTADDEGSEEGSAMHAKFVGIVEAVARRIRAPKLLVRDYAKLNSDI